MMSRRNLGIAAASLAAAGIVGAGLIASTGNAFADPTASSTPGASQPAKQRTPGAAPSSEASTGARQGGKGGTKTAPVHTEVTGAEADKVIAAVKAKDSAFTATKVEKDADGSYDVTGTKDGANVRYEVSADLATVTLDERKGAGKGGKGDASQDTPVTGAEADKVIAAVKAKDSAVSVTSVRKDPDGSYDALGTKDGKNVMVEVSADLQTIEVRTGR